MYHNLLLICSQMPQNTQPQSSDYCVISQPLVKFLSSFHIMQVENLFFFHNQTLLFLHTYKSIATLLQKHLADSHHSQVAFNLSVTDVLRNIQLRFQVNCFKTSVQFLSQWVSHTSLTADHWVVTQRGGGDANRKWSTSLLMYDQRLSAGGRHRAPPQPYAHCRSVGALWLTTFF